MKARFYPSTSLRTGFPVVGRFLQPDSIVLDPANPQSLNRYRGACPERSRRVLNNPMRYADPTGLYHSGFDVCLIHLGCDATSRIVSPMTDEMESSN